MSTAAVISSLSTIMAAQSPSGARGLLETLLGPDHPSLGFALAVVEHLTSEGGGGRSSDGTLVTLARLLRTLEEPDEEAAGLLAADPGLMASFFQNADLLHPAAPETAEIGRLVMAAMEMLTEDLE